MPWRLRWIAEPPSDAPSALAYWFPRASLAEFTARTFEGVEVFISAGAEEVLRSIYGTWQLPQQKRSFARGPLNLMLWRQEAADDVLRRASLEEITAAGA